MKQSCSDEEINNQAQGGGDVVNIGDTYNGGGNGGTTSANSGASVAGIIGMAVGGVVLVAAVAAFLIGKAVSTIVDTFGCLFCGLSSFRCLGCVFNLADHSPIYLIFHTPTKYVYFAAAG